MMDDFFIINFKSIILLPVISILLSFNTPPCFANNTNKYPSSDKIVILVYDEKKRTEEVLFLKIAGDRITVYRKDKISQIDREDRSLRYIDENQNIYLGKSSNVSRYGASTILYKRV